jgi:putative chitinase
MGNGDEASGDGWRYRGRGLIQITGKENYAACGSALGLPLLDHPELLEKPDGAAMSAAWFWQTHGCNELADVASFSTITRRINGGLNGQDDRVRYWIKAKSALEIAGFA